MELPSRFENPNEDHEDDGLTPEERELLRLKKLLRKRKLWSSFFEDSRAGIRFNQDPQKRDPQNDDHPLTPLQLWIRDFAVQNQNNQRLQNTPSDYVQNVASLSQLFSQHLEQKITEATAAISTPGLFSEDSAKEDYTHEDLVFLLQLQQKLVTEANQFNDVISQPELEPIDFPPEVNQAFSEVMDQINLAATGQEVQLDSQSDMLSNAQSDPLSHHANQFLFTNHGERMINVIDDSYTSPVNPEHDQPNPIQSAEASNPLNEGVAPEAPQSDTPSVPTRSKIALGGAFAAGYAMGKIKKVTTNTPKPAPVSSQEAATHQQPIQEQAIQQIPSATPSFDTPTSSDTPTPLRQNPELVQQRSLLHEPEPASNTVPIINYSFQNTAPGQPTAGDNLPDQHQAYPAEKISESLATRQPIKTATELKNGSVEVSKMKTSELLQMAGRTKFQGQTVTKLFESKQISRSDLEDIVKTMFYGGSVLATIGNALQSKTHEQASPVNIAAPEHINTHQPAPLADIKEGQTDQTHQGSADSTSHPAAGQPAQNVPVAKSGKRTSILVILALLLVLSALILLAIYILTL